MYNDYVNEEIVGMTVFHHDDVIKWKHFPRYWTFVRRIHRSLVNSPRKGQWRGALICSLICLWINGWVNNREAGDLRRYRAHYDVTEMIMHKLYNYILMLIHFRYVMYIRWVFFSYRSNCKTNRTLALLFNNCRFGVNSYYRYCGNKHKAYCN